jgi:acetyl-CoA acetyltransferase
MGVCADLCATEYEFSREDQDNYAIQSYERSAKAWEAGKFDRNCSCCCSKEKEIQLSFLKMRSLVMLK